MHTSFSKYELYDLFSILHTKAIYFKLFSWLWGSHNSGRQLICLFSFVNYFLKTVFIIFPGIRVMSKKLYSDLQKILENKAADLQRTDNLEDLKQLEAILDVTTQQLQSGQTESKIGALNWYVLLQLCLYLSQSISIYINMHTYF